VLVAVDGQLLEADGVLLYVVAVVEVFLDEDVDPGEQERQVGAGLDGQPAVGLGGGGGEARVHHHQLRPAPQGFGEVLQLGVVGVLADVVADQDDVACVRPVHRGVAPDRAAEGPLTGGLPGRDADRDRRLGDVGGAPGSGQVLGEPGLAAAVGEEGDALRPVLLPDRAHALGDEVEGLVPARPPELPLPTFSGAEEGVLEPVGVV